MPVNTDPDTRRPRPAHDTHAHDHDACVSRALERAATLCAERDARLTALRRRVLELVWSSHRPIGAYEILTHMSADGRRVAPPTVYRALDFLLELGLVHRIASLNAFVGCDHPERPHQGMFLICRTCRHATEMRVDTLVHAVGEAASRSGFTLEGFTLEATGLCAACRAAETG